MITEKKNLFLPLYYFHISLGWGNSHGVGRLIALKVREIYSEKGMTLNFFFFFAIMFTNWHAE